MTTFNPGDVVALTIFGTKNAHRYIYFIEKTEILSCGNELLHAHWIDNNGTAERIINKIPSNKAILYRGPINQDRYFKR